MTNYGFTGSQKGTNLNIILNTLISLNLKEGDVIITGACIGIDAQVSHIVIKHFPFVNQLIIVPFNRNKVDNSVLNNGKVIYMPPGTDYRDRNIEIVKRSDKIIAFWSGKKVYSGTYMTINIAKKYGKLYKIVNI